MKHLGRKGTIGLALIGTLTLLLAGCSNGTPDPTQIALFGDSLAWEAQPYYDELAHAAGDVPHTYVHGGTAICDWLTRMTDVEAQYHPTEVELEFSGNNLTPCMKGYEPYTPQYYEKYKTDTLNAIETLTAGGAHVFLVGAPITQGQQSEPEWDQLNRQYEEIAAANPAHVTYVDAGTAVELPGHRYTNTLPCLEHEPCTGPVVDGVHSNVVRSSDGSHFCPIEVGNESGVIGGCSVYSSGAYRYATAMFNALTQ